MLDCLEAEGKEMSSFGCKAWKQKKVLRSYNLSPNILTPMKLYFMRERSFA
jgi:hypothetical protein